MHSAFDDVVDFREVRCIVGLPRLFSRPGRARAHVAESSRGQILLRRLGSLGPPGGLRLASSPGANVAGVRLDDAWADGLVARLGAGAELLRPADEAALPGSHE